MTKKAKQVDVHDVFDIVNAAMYEMALHQTQMLRERTNNKPSREVERAREILKKHGIRSIDHSYALLVDELIGEPVFADQKIPHFAVLKVDNNVYLDASSSFTSGTGYVYYNKSEKRYEFTGRINDTAKPATPAQIKKLFEPNLARFMYA